MGSLFSRPEEPKVRVLAQPIRDSVALRQRISLNRETLARVLDRIGHPTAADHAPYHCRRQSEALRRLEARGPRPAAPASRVPSIIFRRIEAGSSSSSSSERRRGRRGRRPVGAVWFAAEGAHDGGLLGVREKVFGVLGAQRASGGGGDGGGEKVGCVCASIVSLLSFVATAAFAAPAEEGLLERSFDKRAGCPNYNAQVACERACSSVVAAACKACGNVNACLVECQRARYKSCYSCCDSKCTTC
ncbi:hypothetical protein VTH06DRAFT_5435 [Thermothelomyces fergusii]